MSAKIKRRVLVQLINSHRHVEMVEVDTLVRATGGFGTEGFEADLHGIEADARRLLACARKDEPDFDVVGVLCAVTNGHYAGRIVWVRQAETIPTGANW